MTEPPVSYDWLAHHARTRGSKVAVIDVPSDRRLTYAEVDERTERLAAYLTNEHGVRRGDRVAVLSKNSSNMFEAQFACWKLGAIFVPLSWRLAAPELDFILADCTPSVLLHGVELTGTTDLLSAAPPLLSWGPGADGRDDYEAVLASTPSTRVPRGANTLATVLSIMYTSGTTGRPKGVVITQGMVLWNVVNQTEVFRTGSTMVNLVVLPLFHTGGLNCFANPAFHYGGANVVMGPFEAALGLRLLTSPELAITHLQSVPANYLFMSQRPEFAAASFPSLLAAGVGGSPAPHSLLELWASKGVYLQQAFGMTETGSMVMALPRQDAIRKMGSSGLQFLHNEVRVVDADGVDVSQGTTGELWARGPNITPGYWNLPETSDTSFSDGWLRTGDLVRQDEDGYYFVVDRLKDMYISGGENISPTEVENVIYQLEPVAEVAVIGVPDERWQEVGRAFVVRKAGYELTREQILEHCAAHLARFKIPKSIVFVDELPHNATGKIVKRALASLVVPT